MAKKVLFIVEGYNDEPDLIAKMYSSCFLGKSDTYEFYVFDTNIHQLAPKLIVDGAIDDDLDLKLVLRSEETDPEKLAILSQKYSDIFMIFDFDPQQRDVDLKNIGLLLAYFTDSTEMGKLFINYPMMQSYKHLVALPDLSFIGKKADHPDVLHYKELVDEQALAELKQVKKYTFETFVSLTTHHLMQCQNILRGSITEMSVQEYLNIDFSVLFDKQLDLWIHNDSCYVLNTSLFILIDYMPEKFFQQIYRHRENYRIL